MKHEPRFRLGKEEAHVNGRGRGAYLWLGRGSEKDGWSQIVAFGPGPAHLRALAYAILDAVGRKPKEPPAP
jgi:hypothetical protein